MLPKRVLKILFSKRLSCHLPGMVQDSSAWRQDYGLINLLALQLCQSRFSLRFQSVTAASSFILVGSVWLCALAVFHIAGGKKSIFNMCSCAWSSVHGGSFLTERLSVKYIDRWAHWYIEEHHVPNIEDSYFSLRIDEYTAAVLSGGLGVNLVQRNDCAIFALSLTLFLKAWGNLNVTYLAMTSLCPLGTSRMRSFTQVTSP